MTVWIVRNLAGELGGVFSKKEYADKRIAYLEGYGEPWFVCEVIVDYFYFDYYGEPIE